MQLTENTLITAKVILTTQILNEVQKSKIYNVVKLHLNTSSDITIINEITWKNIIESKEKRCMWRLRENVFETTLNDFCAGKTSKDISIKK